MRKLVLPILTLTLVLSITGCDRAKETLGLKRGQTDEFEVMNRQPLYVPKNYSMRPPADPSTPPTNAISPTDKAKKSLLKDSSVNSSRSDAEKELLSHSNFENIDPSIRAQIAKEVPKKQKKDFGEKLAFWKDKTSKKSGDVIDPHAESKAYNTTKTPSNVD